MSVAVVFFAGLQVIELPAGVERLGITHLVQLRSNFLSLHRSSSKLIWPRHDFC